MDEDQIANWRYCFQHIDRAIKDAFKEENLRKVAWNTGKLLGLCESIIQRLEDDATPTV